MNRQEFLNLTAFITSLYPDKSPFKVGEMQQTALDSWFMMLEDMPYPEAVAALRRHVSASVYFPTVADIRREYDARNVPKPKTALQAYLNVQKAVRKYGIYQVDELLDSLDENERRALKAFGIQRFNDMAPSEYMEKEFARYYDAVCTEMIVI